LIFFVLPGVLSALDRLIAPGNRGKDRR